MNESPMAQKPRVMVAMLGARRNYAVPRALNRIGMLSLFCTDLIRRPLDIPADRIATLPMFGFKRTFSSIFARKPANRMARYLKHNRQFCQLVVNREWDDFDAVYTFNAAGLEILQHASSRGCRCIVDQTAAPWCIEEPLVQQERDRWQAWEFEGATPENWAPLADRERSEWRLADVIVCGSEYVARAIAEAGGPSDKCVVIPYGLDIPEIRQPAHADRGNSAINVLFVGTIQLRKGIQYLMEAAQLLHSAQFHFRAVGGIAVSKHAAAELRDVIELVGPVSRNTLASHYAWANVLVAPSISEGSANVCYEALARGIPVITTPESGSVVRDGQEGFVVPARSPQDIAERLTRLAGNRPLLSELSANALLRAREFSLDHYADHLAVAVKG